MSNKLQSIGRHFAGREADGSLYRGGAATIAGGHTYQGRECFGLQGIGRLMRNGIPNTETTTPLIGIWAQVLQIVGERERIEIVGQGRVEVKL